MVPTFLSNYAPTTTTTINHPHNHHVKHTETVSSSYWVRSSRRQEGKGAVRGRSRGSEEQEGSQEQEGRGEVRSRSRGSEGQESKLQGTRGSQGRLTPHSSLPLDKL